MKIKWKNLITALVIPLAVGGISGFVTQKNMNVFKSLDKPPLTPPEWAFPVIWTIVFVLMGISTYIISVSDTEKSLKNSAYLNYAVQLAVNFFWTVIFFAFKKYLFAFIWLILLLFWIIQMILSFNKISKTSALIQLPYLIWTMFAGYINLGVYLLNR